MSVAHEVDEPTRRFARVLGPYFLVLSVIVIAACLFISTAMQLFGSSS